jgi:hypothetical protein
MILKPAKYFQKSYRSSIKGAYVEIKGTVVSAISVDQGETICKVQVDEATSKAISKLENEAVAYFTDNQEALMVTTKKRYDVMASFQSCTHVDHILKLRVVGDVNIGSHVGAEVTFKLCFKTLVIYKNHSYVTVTIENLLGLAPDLLPIVTSQLQAKLDTVLQQENELLKVLSDLSGQITMLREQINELPNASIEALESLLETPDTN